MIHVDINPDAMLVIYWWGIALLALWSWLLIYRAREVIRGDVAVHVHRLPYFYKFWILPRLDSSIYIWQLGFVQLVWHTRDRYRRAP